MDRLSILLLVLGFSRIQALFCGGSMAKECVQRNRCRIGTETGRPIIDFRGLNNGNQGCESGQTCCPKTEILQYPVQADNQPLPTECGHVNRIGVGFTITNARDIAQKGELPWMVALLDSRSRLPLGGGSLITRDVVLTSSTKTLEVPEKYLIVRAGEWDFESITEERAHEDVAIRKIVRHTNLSVENGANNAALLFLARPLKLDHHIGLICLPPPNRNFIHNRCIVSGWGKKTALDNSYMNILKKIELPLVDRSVCQTKLQGPYGKDFILDNSLICAGGEPGKDTCKGDGGAPLACPLQSDPNRYELLGIVNFGFGCGGPLPAAYTDVSQIRSWIDNCIQAEAVHYSPQLGNVGQSPAPLDRYIPNIGLETQNEVHSPVQGSLHNVVYQTGGVGYIRGMGQGTAFQGPVQVGELIPNEGTVSGGLVYDSNEIQKFNQGGIYIPHVGQGNSDNRYYPNPEIGAVPVGNPIPNEGNAFGGRGYDFNEIQKHNQGGRYIPHVGHGNGPNAPKEPLKIGGNIPNVGQGNRGNRYDLNPEIGAVPVGNPIPNEGNAFGGRGYDLNEIQKHNQGGRYIPHVGHGNGPNAPKELLKIGGNIPNVGQGNRGNIYDPNPEIGAVPVGNPIPNEGNAFGGRGYDLNEIQKHNQGGRYIPHVGHGNGPNAPKEPLKIGGNIPNVGQGNRGNIYDPNPEIGAVPVGNPIPNEGNAFGGRGYDLNEIQKHNQGGRYIPHVGHGNGPNAPKEPLKIGGNIPNVGQGNRGNRYDPNPEIGAVPVGNPIPNEGNAFGGRGYDLNEIQKHNQGGRYIPHVGHGNGPNAPKEPLKIGGNIPNVGQGNRGNRYDLNPEIGHATFGATGTGMQGNNIDNPYKNNLGDRAENELERFPLENPNRDHVIRLSDFLITTPTPSAPIKLVIEKI
uniref:Peptidase S1 domain-containing protein n=2 Tax=Drosophila melanogaster TaxID=7227 RepID=Q8IP30_DROME|eukprot:NP_723941.2 uncharacterized protein Dmel_CG4793 [Drosophila melanogaster]